MGSVTYNLNSAHVLVKIPDSSLRFPIHNAPLPLMPNSHLQSAYLPVNRNVQLYLDAYHLPDACLLNVDIVTIICYLIYPAHKCLHTNLYLVNHSHVSSANVQVRHAIYAELLLLPFPQTTHGHFPVLLPYSEFFAEIINFVLLKLIFYPFAPVHSFHLKTFYIRSHILLNNNTKSSAYNISLSNPSVASYVIASVTATNSNGRSTNS